MQLLTASKLSTVAMLAMAAVLHFSVSAVPMVQRNVKATPTAVKETPTVRAPPAVVQVAPPAAVQVVPAAVEAPPNPYKSNEGNPSPQAFEDLEALFDALPPPKPQQNGPSSSGDAPQPEELTEEDINRMNVSQLKEAIYNKQDQSNLAKERLSPLTKELNNRLNQAWDWRSSQPKPQQMSPAQYKEVISASPAWESVVQEVYGGKQLEECPYHLLPYDTHTGTPVERLQGQNPSEEELLEVAKRHFAGYSSYVRNNICRLVVNGAYPWLLKILAMHHWRSDPEIFSVLGQLGLFTPNKALAHDLNGLLKLFGAISKADGITISISSEATRSLILSAPEAIPALALSSKDMIEALLLYLAVMKHQEGKDTHLVVGEKNLLETLNIGNINVIARNYFPANRPTTSLFNYLFRLTNDIFQLDGESNVSRRTAIDNLFNRPSTRFAINQETRRLDFTSVDKLGIHPFEVLVSVLTLDQFINLYGSMPSGHKVLELIIMAGRSRQGPAIMNFVFHDVLGEGKGIKEGVKVERHSLSTDDLAQLVQGCAMVCTKENWLAFVDLFVKKVKNTEQLSAHAISSATSAHEVTDYISSYIDELGQKLETYDFRGDDERRQKVTDDIGAVTTLMSEVGKMLSDDNYYPTSGTKSAAQAQVLGVESRE